MTLAKHLVAISAVATIAMASIAKDFVFSDPEGDISVSAAPGDVVKNTPPAKRICVRLNDQPAVDNVKRVDDLLTSAGYFFLATADGDQPKLRPLGAHFVADGRIIFGVGDFKNVYKQLVKNPKTEIVAMVDGKGKWLRYTGRVVFAEGDALRRYVEMTFERMPGLRDIYNEKTGNNLRCFWLEDASAELIDMMPPGEKIEL